MLYFPYPSGHCLTCAVSAAAAAGGGAAGCRHQPGPGRRHLSAGGRHGRLKVQPRRRVARPVLAQPAGKGVSARTSASRHPCPRRCRYRLPALRRLTRRRANLLSVCLSHPAFIR